MSTNAIDVSQWNGIIDWNKVPQLIAVIRMSSGDGGLHYDARAAANYKEAKAAGKAVGLYHFAGTGAATTEADFFIKACSPLEKDDVLILDWEQPLARTDAVAWCRDFIQRVKDKTGVTCIIYMNTSTENKYDWSPVINMNVGLWIADYRYTAAQNVPIKRWKSYIMHQYTSKGTVAGIASNVDMDVFFGTSLSFRKYGYQPVAASSPAPAPTPMPVPVPVTPAPVEPVESEKDKEQDAKLNSLTTLVNKIADFLASIFSGFKK